MTMDSFFKAAFNTSGVPEGKTINEDMEKREIEIKDIINATIDATPEKQSLTKNEIISIIKKALEEKFGDKLHLDSDKSVKIDVLEDSDIKAMKRHVMMNEGDYLIEVDVPFGYQDYRTRVSIKKSKA